jgi:hypothetical protein
VCARSTCALTYGAAGDARASGVMNAPLESIARDLGFEGDTVLKGAVVTVMIVGGVIGGVVIGPMSDSIGRRTALGVTCVPLMAGPLISGLSGSLEPMIIGRFLTGIGIGASSALVPLYLSEVRVEQPFSTPLARQEWSPVAPELDIHGCRSLPYARPPAVVTRLIRAGGVRAPGRRSRRRGYAAGWAACGGWPS